MGGFTSRPATRRTATTTLNPEWQFEKVSMPLDGGGGNECGECGGRREMITSSPLNEPLDSDSFAVTTEQYGLELPPPPMSSVRMPSPRPPTTHTRPPEHTELTAQEKMIGVETMLQELTNLVQSRAPNKSTTTTTTTTGTGGNSKGNGNNSDANVNPLSSQEAFKLNEQLMQQLLKLDGINESSVRDKKRELTTKILVVMETLTGIIERSKAPTVIVNYPSFIGTTKIQVTEVEVADPSMSIEPTPPPQITQSLGINHSSSRPEAVPRSRSYHADDDDDELPVTAHSATTITLDTKKGLLASLPSSTSANSKLGFTPRKSLTVDSARSFQREEILPRPKAPPGLS